MKGNNSLKGGDLMKKIIAVCLCLIVLCSMPISVYASSIQPYYNNVDRVNTVFTISDSGVATVKNSYTGITGTMKSAKISTKVQKKVGIIWVTVDNGSWTDNSSSNDFAKSHSVQLSGKGTNRAHTVFTFSGSGGSDDKITKNVEKTYS